jgi:hypothetical protein
MYHRRVLRILKLHVHVLLSKPWYFYHVWSFCIVWIYFTRFILLHGKVSAFMVNVLYTYIYIHNIVSITSKRMIILGLRLMPY